MSSVTLLSKFSGRRLGFFACQAASEYSAPCRGLLLLAEIAQPTRGEYSTAHIRIRNRVTFSFSFGRCSDDVEDVYGSLHLELESNVPCIESLSHFISLRQVLLR